MLRNKNSRNSSSGTEGSDGVRGELIETGQGGHATIKKKKRRNGIIISVIAIVLIGAVGFNMLRAGAGRAVQASGSHSDYTVGTRDILLSLSGTGSLKPADSYTVTTLISGDILQAPFEEGTIVEKDTILYEVESSNVATSIEQAELSLSQSNRSYEQKMKTLEDLKVKADETGEIIELLVETGDRVTAGQTLARIRNSAVMSLVVPFGGEAASGFTVGQSAQVILDSSLEILNGTVSKISSVVERLDGNVLVRQVTVDVSNPGGIAAGESATAIVGEIESNGSGTFSYKGEGTVTAAVSGEVSALNAKEGEKVQKNQVVVTLSSDTLENDAANSAGQLRDAELSLQNKYDQLQDYTIKSPIAGTIIEKNYKEGDTLEAGKALCTIFDLSYLTMTLNVDELDISQVQVGQKVNVTVEALPDKVYEGSVTKVNINGTTANGVTSYPVTIRIDETEGLLPGMNVQANITVSSKTGVVAIPVKALSRGNRVLVKTDAAAGQAEGETGAPQGFAYVEVTPGISDGEYIEIIDGLRAEDIIAVMNEVIPSTSQSGFGPSTGRGEGGSGFQGGSPGGIGGGW